MRQLVDPEAKRLYEEELLVGEAMENVIALLRSLGVSQRDLATRLGVTESRVSQIVSGTENLTLRSLAGLGWCLGVRFELDPVALNLAERAGTPAENDPAPPLWLSRLHSLPRARWLQHVAVPPTRARPPFREIRVETEDRAVAA
jgi:transcriptional regulator with XRE-family HTH domain